MPEITIPYRPRDQFMPLHDRVQRWGVIVAHVRAGKTVACINELIRGALTCPLPNPRFAYVAPYYSQAKDVAWNYLKHYTAPIPGIKKDESELFVDLPNGGRVRLYGSNNYERLRGIYLDGVILDEYGDMDPRAWKEVIRGRLSDRNGWAMFIGTPQGMNHFAEVWSEAQHQVDWYKAMLKASQTGLISQAELIDAQKHMSEEEYAAQYECSFAASVIGSIWGREIHEVETDGRICRVAYQPEIKVDTWWDLGMDDTTAIWFTQDVGRELHVIDCYENSGAGLPHYAKVLQERGYVYGQHHAPHDIRVRELGTGNSRLETAAKLGIRFEVVADIPKADGIDAGRAFFARCWFDRVKCEAGLAALKSYRRTRDEKRSMPGRPVYSAEPLHDWSSNFSDAFRYLAVGHKITRQRVAQPTTVRWMEPTSEPSRSWMGI
jgi:hypothetical protein